MKIKTMQWWTSLISKLVTAVLLILAYFGIVKYEEFIFSAFWCLWAVILRIEAEVGNIRKAIIDFNEELLNEE